MKITKDTTLGELESLIKSEHVRFRLHNGSIARPPMHFVVEPLVDVNSPAEPSVCAAHESLVSAISEAFVFWSQRDADSGYRRSEIELAASQAQYRAAHSAIPIILDEKVRLLDEKVAYDKEIDRRDRAVRNTIAAMRDEPKRQFAISDDGATAVFAQSAILADKDPWEWLKDAFVVLDMLVLRRGYYCRCGLPVASREVEKMGTRYSYTCGKCVNKEL